MKKFAVIVAGGMGVRMGAAVPKQFLLLREHPVLWYTIDAFLGAYDDLRIVLVVPAGHRDAAKGLFADLPGAGRIGLVDGGDTRFHSVRNGLEWIRREVAGTVEMAGDRGEVGREAIIFVHDGVRCLVSTDLIRRCYEQAAEARVGGTGGRLPGQCPVGGRGGAQQTDRSQPDQAGTDAANVQGGYPVAGLYDRSPGGFYG